MGLFNLFKKEETAGLPYEKDAVFEHILNIFFDFKDKYPDKIVSLGIYPSEKIVGDDVDHRRDQGIYGLPCEELL